MPDEANQHRIVAGAAFITQQFGVAAVVGHEQIEIAVVVDVAGDQRPSDFLRREACSRLAADFSEPPAAAVSQQQFPLRFGGARPDMARAVHHMAVDDAEIEIGVVVVVDEGRAEADVGERRRTDAARECRVLEQALAEIAEQRVRLELVIA